jgi:hypothetical protein
MFDAAKYGDTECFARLAKQISEKVKQELKWQREAVS